MHGNKSCRIAEAYCAEQFAGLFFGNVCELSCNGIILNYAVILYDKSKSNIQIVQDIAEEILDTYTKRWPIELFFRQSKSKLALDKYQIRSKQGIQRYWLIMSLVHYLCCTCRGKYCTFEEGYLYLQKQLKTEQIEKLYQSIKMGHHLMKF